MQDITTAAKSVQTPDGDMTVFLSRPRELGPFPGLLVFQEAFGVNEHIRDVAQRFAAAGYIAAAPELFHRTAPGFQGSYDDVPAAMEVARTVTLPGLEEDIRATYGLLANDQSCDGRIASIGFCMGGRVSFLANSIVPLRAAVSFYGGGIAPGLLDRAAQQNGRNLFFWGGLDRHIGEDQRRAVREALDAAGKPYVDTLFSSADHGFFCDLRASHSPAASRQAWALTLAFLASTPGQVE